MLKQQGYDLMEAAFEVCIELGYGMAEEVYQQSLEIELHLRSNGRIGMETIRTKRPSRHRQQPTVGTLIFANRTLIFEE